jgi:hypothetical protein
MATAKAREVAEQWIVPPEPALDRYLLRSRHRAANDNRRLSSNTFHTVQIGACIALISALSLIGALVRYVT